MKKQVYNPFLPLWEYIPDGEPHVFGDRVYLFGSHDKENGDTFCMLDYQVWSAQINDLSDWSSKGPSYSAKQDPLYSEEMQYMYAPDCVQGNDGRYYLYYCLAGYRGKGGYSNPVSVAVCDTPDGKYTYYGVVRNPDGTPLLRYACFDPAVINDDGTIRLYFGTTMPRVEQVPLRWLRNRMLARILGKTTAQVREGVVGSYHVELSDDMLTVRTQPVRIDDRITGGDYRNHLFFEGSSIRKIKDTYYFVYSSANNHELCYATSQYPDRDFAYGGTIVSNGDIGYLGRTPEERLNHTGTNHGSIECVNGQWYVFYHRLTHQSDYSRQACAEKIEILPDGSIPQVEITSCGLNEGVLSGTGTYPATICCNLTNGNMRHGSNNKKTYEAPMVTSRDEERFVGNVGDQTLIGYKYFSLAGTVQLTLSTRGSFQGKAEILTELDGKPVAVISVEPTESWRSFMAQFAVPQGTYPIYLRFIGQRKAEFIEFTLETL